MRVCRLGGTVGVPFERTGVLYVLGCARNGTEKAEEQNCEKGFRVVHHDLVDEREAQQLSGLETSDVGRNANVAEYSDG